MTDIKKTTLEQRVVLYHVRHAELVCEAYNNGVILTVETEPVQPLAMGNYVMRGHARARRDWEQVEAREGQPTNDALSKTLADLRECSARLTTQYVEGVTGEPFAFTLEALDQLVDRARMDVEYSNFLAGCKLHGIRPYPRAVYEAGARGRAAKDPQNNKG